MAVPKGAVAAARAVAQVGFPPATRPTAVAIAGAESSYIPTVGAGRCGGQANPCAHACRGLCWWGPWQVNICSHAALLRRLTGRTSACYWVSWLSNWANSAHVAYLLSDGGKNWAPWGSYTSGAYLRYLSDAHSALVTASAVQPVQPTTRTRELALAGSLGLLLLVAL